MVGRRRFVGNMSGNEGRFFGRQDLPQNDRKQDLPQNDRKQDLARKDGTSRIRGGNPNPPAPSYWTNLTAEGGHPNGPLAGCCATHVEHWAVRRYVSEVAGTVTLSGVLSDLDGGNGDGIEGLIFVDGAEVFSALIADGDLAGTSYSVTADVGLGSIVDFAIAPRANDFEDTTRFTAVVTLVPEPGSLALMVLGIGGLCWRKR